MTKIRPDLSVQDYYQALPLAKSDTIWQIFAKKVVNREPEIIIYGVTSNGANAAISRKVRMQDPR